MSKSKDTFRRPGVRGDRRPRPHESSLPGAEVLVLGISSGHSQRCIRTEARRYADDSILLTRVDDEGIVLGSFRLFKTQLRQLAEVLN